MGSFKNIYNTRRFFKLYKCKNSKGSLGWRFQLKICPERRLWDFQLQTLTWKILKLENMSWWTLAIDYYLLKWVCWLSLSEYACSPFNSIQHTVWKMDRWLGKLKSRANREDKLKWVAKIMTVLFQPRDPLSILTHQGPSESNKGLPQQRKATY